MLINSTITRVDTPGMPDATGATAWTQGAAVSIDCFVDEPTRSQKMTLTDLISNASAVLYVPTSDLPTVPTPKVRLLIAVNETAAVLYEVVYVRIRALGSLDHYEAFLQVL